MLKRLAEKVRNLVTIAEITTTTKDEGLDSISQTEALGKTSNSGTVMPYGISSNAPRNSNKLLFSVGGSSQNKIGIPYNTENRFNGLQEGEVQVGNFVTKCSIHFKEDGSIFLKAGVGGGNLKFENTDGKGVFEITEDGKIILNEGTEPAVKGDTFKISHDGHVHPTAFGASGVPDVALTPDNFNDTVLL